MEDVVLHRRDFLAVAAGAVPVLAQPWPARWLCGPRRRGRHRRTLVAVELAGGNDGFNTVVPFAQDAYHRLRPRLRVGERSVLRLTAEVGLHPALRFLAACSARGELAVVPAAGGPPPRGASHEEALAAWRGALPGAEAPPGPTPAAQLGGVLDAMERGGAGDCFRVSLEGFDTHLGQDRSHGLLLRELDTALEGFLGEVAARGWDEGVVVAVSSEFGRALAENACRGTDHGGAGPLLLVGRSVRGGLHGGLPDLETLGGGGLPAAEDGPGVLAALGGWAARPGGAPLCAAARWLRA